MLILKTHIIECCESQYSLMKFDLGDLSCMEGVSQVRVTTQGHDEESLDSSGFG